MNPELLERALAAEAPWGCYEFQALCNKLIADYDLHSLYPVIYRTRKTNWVAQILTYPSGDERAETVTSGEGLTMDAACKNAVRSFHNHHQIRTRKEELMKNPEVVEALRLFGHQAK